MLAVYSKITDEELREEAIGAIKQITQWFADNPRRRTCNAKIWYGKMIKVKRGTVEKQINAARDEALAPQK